MTIATISYQFTPPEYEGRADDIEALQDSIIHALDYHFPDWEEAAAAQAEYSAALDAVAVEGGGLFSADESLRLALAGNPRAAAWAQFMETAQDAGGMLYGMTGLAANGEDFAFSIKFNTATDTKRAAPLAAPSCSAEFDTRGPG